MEDQHLIQHLISQYQASLAMLRQAIELCPQDLWLSTKYRNRYWHIAYHTLFYTHLYVNASEAEFTPWAKHRTECRLLGERSGESSQQSALREPYAEAELLEYYEICCKEVENKVPNVDLGAGSGFHWLPFTRLEVHLYNMRHLQHHTGQLADRLRAEGDIGLPWVRAGNPLKNP